MKKLFALLFIIILSGPAYAQDSEILIPNWLIETEKSPIDGTDMVFVSIDGVASIPGQLGLYPTLLVMACRETQTDIWFVFDDEFPFGVENGLLNYSIDGGPMQNMLFSPSGIGSDLGLWDSTLAIAFIKSMFGADRISVYATPNASDMLVAEFFILGLEQAVEPLRKACRW